MQFNQCFFCKHYTSVGTCEAFGIEKIPAEIFTDQHDHRQPFEGDNGIRFEQNPELDPYYEDEPTEGEPDEEPPTGE